MPVAALTEASLPATSPAPTPAHDIDIRVGRNLRANRKLRSLTQKQLGAGVGLTLQQIQKYENGSNRINVSRLHQFSEILDVPVAEFFSGRSFVVDEDDTAVTDHSSADSAKDKISPDDLELLNLFKTLRPRLKRRLTCLIEEMVDDAR